MKRRWALEEKFSILSEAETGNVVEVCRSLKRPCPCLYK